MYKIEGHYGQKEGRDKEVKEVGYFRQGHLLLGEDRRSYQADYLTNVDQEISD